MNAWDPSHAAEPWRQYGYLTDTGGLRVGPTRRCSRCGMAVSVDDDRVTEVGLAPCPGPAQ